MKFGFTDLFQGIIYTFVIFLPGFLLVLVLGSILLPDFSEALPGGETTYWLTILAGSYVGGHFVSHIGARLEDTKDGRSNHLELENAAFGVVRSLLPQIEMEHGCFRRYGASVLRAIGSSAYQEIERKDADRRFFRNLRPLLLILGSVLAACSGLAEYSYLQQALPHDPDSYRAGAILAFLLFFPAERRFRKQDHDYTTEICYAVLAWDAMRQAERVSLKGTPAP